MDYSMQIVIDTNMIIAALIKDSKAREIITSDKFEFVSPDFVLDEIYKYENYICEKAELSKEELQEAVKLSGYTKQDKNKLTQEVDVKKLTSTN